ncbi:hypothetical protein C7S16_5900 [Burkholderia thailandensis]|uniref:Uncharacterized protein n=1 Tax=Burkholderia thailandensis TaxID=57975 RepID=A0AAW9CUW3_BURTH|nr:hypothetical protein [Burkholderia thailandensis]MDW9252798.1 hypothetical protein [Burkholderia thailandensis]
MNNRRAPTFGVVRNLTGHAAAWCAGWHFLRRHDGIAFRDTTSFIRQPSIRFYHNLQFFISTKNA